MAEALKIRVGYLLTELFAHTLVFLCALYPARTIATCAFKPLFYALYHFFIIIKTYHYYLSFADMLRLFLDKCLYYLADILIMIILVRIPFLIVFSINKALRLHLLNICLLYTSPSPRDA